MPNYVATPDQSRFSVQAFAGGLLSSFAHNPTFTVRKFSATLCFDPASTACSSMEVIAEADSLWLTDEAKPSDREEIERQMQEQVLETGRYPQIMYRSTEIAHDRVAEGWYRLQIQGELSLHGVVKEHPIAATFRTYDDTMRFNGETAIHLSDFRMKKVSALAGTITLRDEVKLAFDFAMRTSPTAPPDQAEA